MAARRPARNVSVSVKVLLTGAELRKLRAFAAADLRSGGGDVAWLLAQELERTARRPRPDVPPHARISSSIPFVLPRPMFEAVRKRAGAELRSVSGYVGRVVVEALADKERR